MIQRILRRLLGPLTLFATFLLAFYLDGTLTGDLPGLAPGVLADPRPKVRIHQISGMGVEYKIRYWIVPAETSPNKARHQVLSAVLRHLRTAGLTLAYPKQDVYHSAMPTRNLDGSSEDDRLALLAKVPLFAALHEDELRILARTVEPHLCRPGEALIHQGEQGDSMFVLMEGLLDVRIAMKERGVEQSVGTIQPGEFFGEVSLLTGEARSATVVAGSFSTASPPACRSSGCSSSTTPRTRGRCRRC